MNNINKDYFMKYLKNELTDDETRQLVAWLRENKENQGDKAVLKVPAGKRPGAHSHSFAP